MFQRVKRLDSFLRNAITRLGTSQGRANQAHVSTGRHLMGSSELDALWTSRLMRRISTELPKDATTDVQILGEDLDTASIQRELDRLDVSRKVSDAAGKARHYGGAALWLTFEGGGLPSDPLDMASVKRVANIVTITRFELSISSALTDAERERQREAGTYSAGFYDMDPRSANYGQPFAYYYYPSKGGKAEIIHASRLIILRGDPVPDHLSSLYQGWGAPLPESLYNTWAQLKQGQNSGAELLTEFGLMVYKFGNLTEIMTGDDRPFLDEWMDLQNISKGLLRAVMLDTNVQDAVRMDVKAQGWSDIYDRIAQMFAAEAEMPVTKLYGQAPGGLSTDDASAWRNWSKTVSTYQRNELSRVYIQILSMVLGSSMGPSGGQVPDNLGVKFEPYEVPSQKEDADTVAVWTKAVIDLTMMGIIDADEARDTMRAVGDQIAFKSHATEEEEEAAGLSEEEASSVLNQLEVSSPSLPAPVAEEEGKLADKALNGAQISSMVDVIERVNGGTMSPGSGIAILMKALNMPYDEARRIVEGDPLQRSDAADITPSLLAEYSTGVGLMVAIYPGEEFATWLAAQEFCSVPADELHLTLCYVPDVKPEDMDAIIEAVEQACASFVQGTGRDVLEFTITGPSIFQNEEDAHVLLLGCVGLNALRFVVRGALAPWIHEEKHDFIPHMTIAYKSNGSSLHPLLTENKISGTFNASSVHVVRNEECHEVELTGEVES